MFCATVQSENKVGTPDPENLMDELKVNYRINLPKIDGNYFNSCQQS